MTREKARQIVQPMAPLERFDPPRAARRGALRSRGVQRCTGLARQYATHVLRLICTVQVDFREAEIMRVGRESRCRQSQQLREPLSEGLAPTNVSQRCARSTHQLRKLIVIRTAFVFTVARNCTRLRSASEFNNWIEGMPFWEMTFSCEDNLRNCTKMFLRHLDFLLPSEHNFSSFGRRFFSFTT